jgi:hypothetical protein
MIATVPVPTLTRSIAARCSRDGAPFFAVNSAMARCTVSAFKRTAWLLAPARLCSFIQSSRSIWRCDM